MTFNKADNFIITQSEVQMDATREMDGQTMSKGDDNDDDGINATQELTTKSIVLVRNSVMSPDKASNENSPTNLHKTTDESIIEEDINMLSTKDRDLKLEEDMENNRDWSIFKQQLMLKSGKDELRYELHKLCQKMPVGS